MAQTSAVSGAAAQASGGTTFAAKGRPSPAAAEQREDALELESSRDRIHEAREKAAQNARGDQEQLRKADEQIRRNADAERGRGQLVNTLA
ncbi:MAG: hypothetical protein HYV63_23800 [Candidatus Schekmanbacteria bacterium]|nr:hypothetical protein [Candidatus Schekmanbacteria bacterium]